MIALTLSPPVRYSIDIAPSCANSQERPEKFSRNGWALSSETVLLSYASLRYATSTRLIARFAAVAYSLLFENQDLSIFAKVSDSPCIGIEIGEMLGEYLQAPIGVSWHRATKNERTHILSSLPSFWAWLAPHLRSCSNWVGDTSRPSPTTFGFRALPITRPGILNAVLSPRRTERSPLSHQRLRLRLSHCPSNQISRWEPI